MVLTFSDEQIAVEQALAGQGMEFIECEHVARQPEYGLFIASMSDPNRSLLRGPTIPSASIWKMSGRVD